MPPETALVPPPPAAPPPSASAAAPAPDNSKEINVPELFKMLMQDVTEEEASGDPTKKKAPEVKLADAAKPVEPPKAAPAVDEPIKVRRPKKERPALPTVDDPPPVAARQQAAAPVAPVVDTEAARKFEEGLEENEREMLADARYLEQKWPEKYKGMTAKVDKFLKEHIAFTKRPDFDEQDPEYSRFLETNQPRLTRSEIRQIEESRIADNLRREHDTKFADLNFRSFTKEKEPEIERIGQQVYAEMTNSSLPEELDKVLREQIGKLGPQKGYEEALKTHKLEVETAEAVLQAAADDIKEFHRLNTKDPTTGRMLADFAETASNPKFEQHQRLANMVDGICEGFKNQAGEDAIRDGKWFVTRKEWLRLRPEARGRFWTFNNAELIQRAKAGIKSVISTAIQQKHEYLKARGWSRSAASSSAPPTPPATSTAKAPPTPAPVPGATDAASSVSATASRLAGQLNAG